MLTLSFNPASIKSSPVVSYVDSDSQVLAPSGFIPIEQVEDDTNDFDAIDDKLDMVWLNKRLKASHAKRVAEKMLAKADMYIRHNAFRKLHEVQPDAELQGLTYAQPKKELPSVATDETMVPHLQLNEWQPQRFMYNEREDSFHQLELTTEEGTWLDAKDGEFYTDEWDSERILYRDEFPSNVQKARTKLNCNEEGWLRAHEQYIEDIDDALVQGYETVSINDTMSNDNDSWTRESTIESDEDPIPFCKDSTELSYDEYKLFGTNKGHDSVIWMALRYSRKSAIDRVESIKDTLSEDTKEWLREMLGDKNITLDKNLRAIMPNAISYTSLTGFIHNLDKGTVYKATDKGTLVRQGYTTYPGTLARARKELGILSDESPKPPTTPTTPVKVPTTHNNKKVFIDYFKSTKSLKEGFLHVWCTDNDKLLKAKQIFFLNDGKLKLDNIVKNSKEKGFNVTVRDIYNRCIEDFGKSPLYSRARTMWNEGTYINSNLKELV